MHMFIPMIMFLLVPVGSIIWMVSSFILNTILATFLRTPCVPYVSSVQAQTAHVRSAACISSAVSFGGNKAYIKLPLAVIYR